MENTNLEQQIQDINRKLDFITARMQEQERRHRELTELKDDLTIIGKDIFQAATNELDEVANHFDTDDLLHLLKRLLRNVKNLSKMMEQVESAADFIEDAAPLGKQVVNQLMDTLNDLDKKGYFEFGSEIFKIVDTVISDFTLQDVRLLRENVTTILMTVKNLTQPQMLASVNNALSFFQKMDVEVEKDISYWQIAREMRDPEMKRGIIFMIKFMKNLVKTNGNMTEQQLETKKS